MNEQGSKQLARHLVLNGTALCVVGIFAIYPIAMMSVIWEVASFHAHPLATLLRLSYVGATVLTAIAAWKKSSVRLAVLFLTMLVVAAAFVVLRSHSPPS